MDGQVDMNGQFSPVVLLEESEFRGELITLVAERLCQTVLEVCRGFVPFFNPHVRLSGGCDSLRLSGGFNAHEGQL